MRPPPVPTIATSPAASSAAIAAEQRGRRARVADRGVDRARRRGASAPTPLGEHRAEPAVGVGERPRAARRTRRACSATSPTTGQEDLLAEEARVVEVAVVDLAVAAVAVEERARARDARADGAPAPPSAASTIAAAPAPQRASKPVPGPGRSASDATTSATRADPAATASAPAASASIPACAEPASSAPPTSGARPERGREEREARALGERRPARAPEQGVDGVGLDAGGVERAVAACHARVSVSSSGAQTATCPRPRPAPGGADVGGGEAQGGRGGADTRPAPYYVSPGIRTAEGRRAEVGAGAPCPTAANVLICRGGGGNRTRVEGFADLCLGHSATPPERISLASRPCVAR